MKSSRTISLAVIGGNDDRHTVGDKSYSTRQVPGYRALHYHILQYISVYLLVGKYIPPPYSIPHHW